MLLLSGVVRVSQDSELMLGCESSGCAVGGDREESVRLHLPPRHIHMRMRSRLERSQRIVATGASSVVATCTKAKESSLDPLPSHTRVQYEYSICIFSRSAASWQRQTVPHETIKRLVVCIGRRHCIWRQVWYASDASGSPTRAGLDGSSLRVLYMGYCM